MNSLRELGDEAKKRFVFVLFCVFGISYLMSLTSSSVWVNLPAAACFIILLRYLSLDLEVRKKPSASNKSPPVCRERNFVDLPTVLVDKLSWRRKVDSPIVEAAIDQISRRLISEWVTDLWYSKITPNKDGPEELILILNNILGEISSRARDINLINLITRDAISLVCNNLKLFRSTQAKIGIRDLGKVSSERRDSRIMLELVSENKLHPALVSPEAEHKALQHLMSGLICLTFKAEDLNCPFFRYTVRELLACGVFRPLLNMANPRFINEKIELGVNVLSKRNQELSSGEDKPSSEASNPLDEDSSGLPQTSILGVELLQFKSNNSSALNDSMHHQYPIKDAETYLSKDSSKVDEGNGNRKESGDKSDIDSIWVQVRGYTKNENGTDDKTKEKGQNSKLDPSVLSHRSNGSPGSSLCYSLSREISGPQLNQADSESDSEDSYQTDDDDGNHVTGLDSPVTMVWDSKNKRNSDVSRIRHPLESFELSSSKRSGKTHSHHIKIARSHSRRKRLRTVAQKIPTRIETERASLLSDGRDDLKTLMKDKSSFSTENIRQPSNSHEIYGMDYSFLKLNPEVLGANIVKSGWETFAVYSIAVKDAANNSWSIKRRFRHFEELHRRLKEFPEYNLHLPPKHFLSSGLEVSVIHERCKLLDKYLKTLLGIPSLSGSIDVWDFLSVDSQTYIFSDSFSILETLSVDLGHKLYDKGDPEKNKERITTRKQSKPTRNFDNFASENMGLKSAISEKESDSQPQPSNSSTSSQSSFGMELDTDHNLPVEWITPNLSGSILDLVDVVFLLKDGGWIRRQVFWIAKQVLQLGMGDALDDWLIHKIQLLRRGSFVASTINRIEQSLWPDGIFLTKHPNRKRPDTLTEEQRLEAARQAEFVHDLVVNKAPVALVGLIGRKEYEQCAHDLYYFLQSSVCLKQVAYELLELILTAVFPELDPVIKEIHQGKHLVPPIS